MSRLISLLVATVVLAGAMVVGVSLVGTRQNVALGAPGRCSEHSLFGGYGVAFDGHSENLGRFASVSLWTFDGAGGLTAKESYNSDSTGPQQREIAGKYTIESDCTFQLFFPSELGHPHEAVGACVLVANATKFSCLDVEQGWVTIGTGTKV